jgi:hypothetical protein
MYTEIYNLSETEPLKWYAQENALSPLNYAAMKNMQ